MLDTKQSWDELVLRHAPDEETAYRILENRLYHEPHRAVRAEPRLHRDGAALRDPRRPASTTSSSSTRRRPGTRSTSSTRPRGWPTSSAAGCCAGSRMPYRVGGKRGTRVINVASRPFYQMADRILGSQFLQDIAEFFLNFQSMYDGFVARAERGRAAPARPAHDVRGRDDARGAPLHEAERFCERARRARLPSRRARPQQDAARLPARRRRRARAADALRSTRRGAIAERLAGLGRSPRSPTRRTARVSCARSGESFRNFSVVATPRGGAARPSSRGVPDVVATRADTSRRHRRRRRVWPRIGRPPLRRAATISRADDPLVDLGGAPTPSPRRRDLVHIATARRVVAAARRPLVRRPLLLAPIAGEEGHRFVVLGAGPARPPGRRTTRRTSSAPSSTRSNGRLSPRAWRRRRDRRGRHRRARRRRSGSGCSASRCAATAGSIAAGHPGDAARRSARRPGELERHYFEVFDRFARHDRRGHVPVRVRRDRDRERAARRRRRDRPRRATRGRGSRARTRCSSLHRMGIHAYASGATARPRSGSTRTRSTPRVPPGSRHRGDRARTTTSVLIRVAPAARSGASASARWCCCATSPTCAAATACCCRRTRPSARSTTG